MSKEIVKSITWKPEKIDELCADSSLSQLAINTGFKPDHLSKIRRGERGFNLKSFAKFCEKTNTTPNDFFQIIVEKV